MFMETLCLQVPKIYSLMTHGPVDKHWLKQSKKWPDHSRGNKTLKSWIKLNSGFGLKFQHSSPEEGWSAQQLKHCECGNKVVNM